MIRYLRQAQPSRGVTGGASYRQDFRQPKSHSVRFGMAHLRPNAGTPRRTLWRIGRPDGVWCLRGQAIRRRGPGRSSKTRQAQCAGRLPQGCNGCSPVRRADSRSLNARRPPMKVLARRVGDITTLLTVESVATFWATNGYLT